MTDALDRFRELVLGDPALQHTLATYRDDSAFAVAAVAIARDRGIIVERAAIERAIRPDPIGIARFDSGPVTAMGWPCPGWLPTAIVDAGGEPAVEWLHFGGSPLDAPFFEESLRGARRRPLNRLVRWRTALSELARVAPPFAAPAGLIFHMSRCGSTLVAQMIAAIAGVVVISEASPIDAIVRYAWPTADRDALLRAMVGAFGRGGTPYVVKLDSWHALTLPLFRAAFPDTPWVFLYRAPIEVMVSQLRMRGLQTVPGALGDAGRISPVVMGDTTAGDILADDIAYASAEIQIARSLAPICEAVIDGPVHGRLLVAYDALPAAVSTRILPHFGIACAAADRAAITVAATRDAKAPAIPFVADRVAKHTDASVAVHAATARYLVAPYRRLVALDTAFLSGGRA